jgi:large subunit ribosomal protein L37Ae
MPKKIKSAVKRFGTRYGRTIREKVSKIENVLRGKHKCPYCSAMKAKRITSGIWECKRCNAKFTGAAYSVERKIKEKEGEEIAS